MQKGWVIRINCDLCGKTTEDLAKAIIEGVQLDVCKECARFGKIISQPKRIGAKEQIRHMQRQVQQKEEKTELLAENYAEIIKKKRESIGMTQKDFASKINEKEATVHKIETGAFKPPIPLVKKLEKVLGVKLIEEYEERHEASKDKRTEGFTLGDFIKIKNRQ